MALDWFKALEPDKETTATFIGVVVAVCGNILISFALNCQKLAHRRIEAAYNAEHGLDDESGSNGATVPGYQAVMAPPVDVIPQPGRSQSVPIVTPGSRSAVGLPREAIPLVVSSSPEPRPSPSSRSRTQSSIRTHSPIRESRETSSSSTPRAEATAVDSDLEAGETKLQRGPEESAYLHSKLW